MPLTIIACAAPQWKLSLEPLDVETSTEVLDSCLVALQYDDWGALVEALGRYPSVPYSKADRIRIPLEIIDAYQPLVRERLAMDPEIEAQIAEDPSYRFGVEHLPASGRLTSLNQYLGLEGDARLVQYHGLVFRESLLRRDPEPARQPLQMVLSEIRTSCACTRHRERGVQIRDLCLSGGGLQFWITDRPGYYLRQLLGLAVGETLTIPQPALTLTCTERGEINRYRGVYTSPDGTELAFQLTWE